MRVNSWRSLAQEQPETGRGVELVGAGLRVRVQLCECEYDERRDCDLFNWLLELPGAPLQWIHTSSRQRLWWRYQGEACSLGHE